MPLDPEALLQLRRPGAAIHWTDRDAMLYALAVGLGRDPADPDERAYVCELPALRVLPSFASSLADIDLLDDCGWDFARVLHVGERLQLHRPLSEAGTASMDARVRRVRDLGPERGALIEFEADARDVDRQPLFSVHRQLLAGGDGGCGGETGRGPAPHPLPARPPDLDCAFDTRAEQALLFRLCGDRNPLHADPELAGRFGWPLPPLHGLCTWGIACCAILRTICEFDATLIRSLEGRFPAPVFPGDALVTDMWQQANIVSFRVRVPARDVVVLDHGRCELAA